MDNHPPRTARLAQAMTMVCCAFVCHGFLAKALWFCHTHDRNEFWLCSTDFNSSAGGFVGRESTYSPVLYANWNGEKSWCSDDMYWSQSCVLNFPSSHFPFRQLPARGLRSSQQRIRQGALLLLHMAWCSDHQASSQGLRAKGSQPQGIPAVQAIAAGGCGSCPSLKSCDILSKSRLESSSISTKLQTTQEIHDAKQESKTLAPMLGASGQYDDPSISKKRCHGLRKCPGKCTIFGVPSEAQWK